MKLFKKKDNSENSRRPWYQRFGIWVAAVATIVGSLILPSKTAVFAASIVKTYVGMYYNGTVAGMVTYNGDPAYCIQMESHMPQPWGHNGVSGDVYSTTSTDAFSGLSSSDKLRMSAITYYGYGYGGRTSPLYYYATQQAIWDMQGYPNISWSGYASTSQVQTAKAEILADVNNYLNNQGKVSNFVIQDSNGNTVASGQNVSFDKAVVGATYTITDTNGNLASSSVTANAFGSRATINGNKITVKMDTSDYGVAKTISVQGPSTQLPQRGQGLVLYASSYQNLLTVTTPSNSSGTSSVTLKGYGVPVDITKKAEDGGTLAGATLSLYKVNGATKSLISTYTSSTSAQHFDLCPGNYQLVEDAAPQGYYKSQPVSFTVETKPYETQSFSMTDKPLKIGIYKVGAQTGTAVEGAHLKMTDTLTNQVVYEFDTNSNYVKIPNNVLKAGNTYYIEETYNPPGYYALDGKIVIQIPEYEPSGELDDAGYKVFNVLDDEIDYRVLKLAGDTGEGLVGAKMQIKQGDTVIEEWVTDGTEHMIDKAKLEVGKTYSIHEVSAPKGYYVMAEDISFTVDKNIRSTYRMTAIDRVISYYVMKTDEEGGAIAGATLMLCDENHNELDRWISEVETTHKLQGLEDGKTYTIEEINPADGYYPTTTVKKFTVKATSTVAQASDTTITFENYPIEYYVEKIDAKTKQKMAGAEFEIQDKETGEVVDTLTSSSDDKVMMKNLKAGHTYLIHESKAVDGYYYPNGGDTEFTVASTLEEAKKLKTNQFTLTIEDPKISLKITKVDNKTGEYVSGAQLAIFDTLDTVDTDGNAVQPLYQWTTDADEPITISDYVTLKAGSKYYIREMETATGYYLNEDVTEIDIPTNIKDGKTLIATFENVPILWHIMKVDESGNLLTTSKDGSWVTLEVYDTNESLDNNDDDTLIATLETNNKTYKANGYFDMQSYIDQGLVKGGHHYRIHEATAANGYRVAEDIIQEISVSGETDTVLTSMMDEAIHVGIKKTDNNGNLLTTFVNLRGSESFELTVYDEESGEKIVTVDTNSDEYKANGYVDISDYLSAQKSYVVKETKTPRGYYKAKDYSFTVDSLEYQEIDGVQVGMITMIDPVLNARFRKEDKLGNVLTSVNGEGFVFQIFDTKGTSDTSDDEVVGTINTATDEHDEGGWISIGQYLQEATTYRIHENYAPSQYKTQAKDAYITTPGYYVESLGTVQNVVISQ